NRFISSALLSCFRLCNPGFGNLCLRPKPASEFSNLPLRIALIKQATRLVAKTQCGGQQLRAMLACRTSRYPLEAFEQPHPFRLMSRLDNARLYFQPILFKVLSQGLTLRIIQARNEESEQITRAVFENGIAGGI